jgi:hypothetical protein
MHAMLWYALNRNNYFYLTVIPFPLSTGRSRTNKTVNSAVVPLSTGRIRRNRTINSAMLATIGTIIATRRVPVIFFRPDMQALLLPQRYALSPTLTILKCTQFHISSVLPWYSK